MDAKIVELKYKPAVIIVRKMIRVRPSLAMILFSFEFISMKQLLFQTIYTYILENHEIQKCQYALV